MKSNAVHAFIDVVYNGKVYANANYVYGSTVEQAYLRWLPAFNAKKNKNRKASIHMRLEMEDGSLVEAEAGEKFPNKPEKAVFTSSVGWLSGCPICRRLSQEEAAAPAEELLMFHRVEDRPAADDAEEAEAAMKELLEEEAAKQAAAARRKNKKKGGGSGPAAAAVGSEQADAADDSLPVDAAVGGEEPAAGSGGYEVVVPEAPGTQLACHEAAMPDAATLSPMPASAFPGNEDSIAEADKAEVTADLEGEAEVWRIQTEHSREYEDEPPDLHTVVEQLAGVVRNLAATVREESVNVARLREVVATDHAALQQHLRESREDRKVMLQLLSVLANQQSGQSAAATSPALAGGSASSAAD
eukprot:TRINITY_DN15374_c0_g1_i4.p1 TRINITY_DN15374_c0_g1~~TRINITY_DN15374_c0_g1_i4.p1  ORF type:complete len:358 (-),score=124.21 TRINITY_DN15374_c0_g1_i4:140-1213(-)